MIDEVDRAVRQRLGIVEILLEHVADLEARVFLSGATFLVLLSRLGGTVEALRSLCEVAEVDALGDRRVVLLFDFELARLEHSGRRLGAGRGPAQIPLRNETGIIVSEMTVGAVSGTGNSAGDGHGADRGRALGPHPAERA